MEAKVYNQDGIEIIEISGRLEMDKAHPLKQACLATCRNAKSVFLLNKLNFVGSSGIKVFFEIFKDLKEMNAAFKIVGIKDDFQRFSLLLDKAIFEVYPSVDVAIASLKNPELQFNVYQDPSVYSLHPIMPQAGTELAEGAELEAAEGCLAGVLEDMVEANSSEMLHLGMENEFDPEITEVIAVEATPKHLPSSSGESESAP